MVKLSSYQRCLKRKQPKTKKLTMAQFRRNQRACKSKKPKKTTKRKQPKYKGHRTSRGLKQDMKRKSQEPHEIAYRKAKRAGKR